MKIYLVSAVVLWVSACSGPSDDYRAAEKDARRALREQGPQAARQKWLQLAESLGAGEKRTEALYQAAFVLRRADPANAEKELCALGNDSTIGPDHQSRALLDCARLAERDKVESARLIYEVVFRKYPTSAPASTALKRWLALSSEPLGELMPRFVAELRGTPLASLATFEWAKAIEPSAPARAVEVYESLAQSDPLPRGLFTDDALLASARLRRQLGDPEGAVSVLDILLETPSEAHIVGSYERSSLAQAELMAAEIERTDLDRPQAAETRLGGFAARHPDSRLLDDAIFLLALMQQKRGDTVGSCHRLSELRERRPESRFVRCSDLACPAAAHPTAQCCTLAPADLAPESCLRTLP